jgi:hypothetical protein
VANIDGTEVGFFALDLHFPTKSSSNVEIIHPFRLANLPTELRLRICDLAGQNNDPVELDLIIVPSGSCYIPITLSINQESLKEALRHFSPLPTIPVPWLRYSSKGKGTWIDPTRDMM